MLNNLELLETALDRDPETVVRAFWRYVHVEYQGEGKPDRCWCWVGTFRNGAPAFRIPGDAVSIVIGPAAYMIFFGRAIDARAVRRSCKDISCVNPRHMSLKRDERKSRFLPSGRRAPAEIAIEIEGRRIPLRFSRISTREVGKKKRWALWYVAPDGTEFRLPSKMVKGPSLTLVGV